MGDYQVRSTSRSELQKTAVQGGISLGAGVALLVLKAVAGIPILGLIAGIAMAGFGYSILQKKSGRSSAEFLQGAVLTATGVLTGLAGLGAIGLNIPLITGLSSGLLWFAGVGLVVYGAWKLIQYRRDYKRRIGS